MAKLQTAHKNSELMGRGDNGFVSSNCKRIYEKIIHPQHNPTFQSTAGSHTAIFIFFLKQLLEMLSSCWTSKHYIFFRILTSCVTRNNYYLSDSSTNQVPYISSLIKNKKLKGPIPYAR